ASMRSHARGGRSRCAPCKRDEGMDEGFSQTDSPTEYTSGASWAWSWACLVQRSGFAHALPFCDQSQGDVVCSRDTSGKLKVTPVVNSQSGAPRLNPLLIPASTTALSQEGCQSTPRRPELLAACPWTLSPSISPANRTVAPMGSSVITPQTPKGRVASRSTPPPRFRWKVNGDIRRLTMPTP